jgi:Cys-tRNA(Pro)/Cys-tRNA(Cys) deacylase
MATGGTRALDELQRAAIPHSVHPYDVGESDGRDRSARHHWGEDAAAALGVPRERIFKTLVAAVDGRLTVAVVPVSAELDLKALAETVGGRRAGMADPVDAERATGYVRGGISPIGLRRRLPTVIDRSATSFATVFVSAGRRGLQLALAPDDLVRITSAVVGDIARDR